MPVLTMLSKTNARTSQCQQRAKGSDDQTQTGGKPEFEERRVTWKISGMAG
jgi:hypothetical protein